MPIYQLTGKDGKVYQIEGPAGLSREAVQAAILKRAPQAGVPPQEKGVVEDYLEEVPLIGGFLTGAADIGLAGAQGAAGAIGSVAEAFGADNAVASFFDDISKGAGDLISAEEKGDLAAGQRALKEAEDKGILEQVKAAAYAFSKSPLTMTAQALGSVAPVAATTLLTGGVGGAALGVAQGAGAVKGSIYDGVEQAAIERGVDPKTAKAMADEAQSYLGKNTDQIALGAVLGGIASRFGLEPAAARVVGKEIAESAVERSLLSRMGRGLAAEALPEAAQAGQERMAQNIALQREDYDVPTMRGVAGQAALEGIMGGVPGAALGAFDRPTPAAPSTEKETPPVPPAMQEAFNELPPEAEAPARDLLIKNFTDNGFSTSVAETIVDKMAADKAAIKDLEERTKAEQEAAIAARTAGIPPQSEPDISAPPKVDTEEQAAMDRMREAEAMGISQPSGGAPSWMVDNARGTVDALRRSNPKIIDTVTDLHAQDFSAAEVAQATGLNTDTVRDVRIGLGLPDQGKGTAGISGAGAPADAQQRAIFEQWRDTYNSQKATPTPSRGARQPTTVTPARAASILSNQAAVSDFAASTGMDTAEAESALYAIANEEPDAPTLKYSRRGRPPSASTLEEAGQEGLFGALPEDSRERLSKREEVAQFQLEQRGKTPEELEAERQARAGEFTAGQEEYRARNEQYKVDFLKNLEETVRRAHPANEAYSVALSPDSPKPYKIVGPDGEVFASADNLQDFEAQAMELDPYTSPPLSAQEVEKDDGLEATAATSMTQELVKEIDVARQRGEIDNNQRAELLAQLQRPAAYDRFGRPQDNIAKAEDEVRKAMSKFRNASGPAAEAAGIELDEANTKLKKLVTNRVMNPVRARLRSISENRQLEREGATSRVESAQVQKRLGEMEGKATPAEDREIREAKIDIEESKASKYRRGEPKQPGGPPKLMSVDRVQAVVDAVTKNWKSKNRVVVLESIMDIKDAKLRRAIEKDGAYDANGFVAPDGTIYLVSDNLISEEDAKAVLFHEALGHLGLEKLFRNNLDNALVTMYRGNAKLRADTDKWRKDNPGAYDRDANPLARAVEEVLAERSERGQLERSFFQKIAAIIRNFARRMGINLKISDGDVAAILSMAHDKIVKGDAESTIVKGMRYINVWHGSPHDFDKFTTGKIGTGEGHAAYGWGLYFTESRAVGEHYRDQEIGRRITIDGQSMSRGKGRRFVEYGGDFTPEERKALLFLRDSRTIENALKRLEVRSTSKFYTAEENTAAKGMSDTLTRLVKEGRLQQEKGRLYNVELAPKSDEWLSWSDPIANQPAKVKEALASLGFVATDERYPLTGADVYNQLRRQLGSKKEASLALLAAGIRGNKYPDGISRGPKTDNPTYNYVVFADEDVALLAKYSRGKNRKKITDAIAGLSAGRRRVENTRSVAGMADGIEEGTKATPTLRDTVAFAEGVSPTLRTAALASMPTSGITGWLQRKAPKVAEVAEGLVDTVRRMNGLRVNLMAAGDTLIRDMDDFVRKHGSQTLASAQFTNRINEIDFLAFGSMNEALSKHRLVVAIEDALVKNSNNKAETRKLLEEVKKQAATEGDKTLVLKDKVNLSAPLTAHMFNLSKLAIDKSAVDLKVKQLAAVSQRIRDSYAVKTELAKQKGGLELYAKERKYHKDMLDARLALLDERVEQTLGKDRKEEATRIRDMRARLMRELQSPTERQKAGDLFWDLDADLFDKEYFPMLRDGQYWLRISEDLSKNREEQFYTFNSAREMKQARRKLAKSLGEDPENRKVFKEGNDIGDLQNTLRETDELMQKVFDIVGKARSEYNSSGDVDMRDLVDSIYQTWLMTTPERSARRHFMHAKQIAGFSMDTLGNIQQQITANANEMTKLAFAGQVRNDIKAIEEVVDDSERPVSEISMLDDFARELRLRAEQELNPPERGALNTFVNALNRFSFYYYLTSAKTALTNFANIPIRVVPRFWREYGYTEGTAMWLKYMKMWESLGRVKMERTNTSFGDSLDALMPNVNGSDFVKNSDDLQWAMKAGTERGILMTTADTLVHNERSNPSAVLTGKIGDVAANTGKVMSFLFTGTENISRQATFYMAFELEMKKQKKDNPTMPLEERRQAALQKAMRIVDDTIGNFADWERPRIAKGEITRAFFLFKMHPILQTKFLVGAFRDIIVAPLAWKAKGKGKLTNEDKEYLVGALKEFSGVLMMGGLLGGLTALPFYTMMAHALAEGFDQEDDDDVRKLMGIDPRTAYDADIMFRRWIMEHLGTSDKTDVDLADVLIGGVPGAVTDTELSSTLSLDLVNMWYREPIAGDSLESTMTAALIANVAGLSMVSSMLKAYEDFDKGNIDDGLKKLLPAFFRAPLTAAFNEAQGVTNRKGDTIIPKEDITGADTFRSALGARSARLARWQDYYITAKKNEDRIKGEKVDILDELERQIDAGNITTQKQFKEFWDENIVPFNRTYPDPDFIITTDSIERSLKGRAERESRTVQGMQVSKKSAPTVLRAAEPFKP
jgi:hypothetical protein